MLLTNEQKKELIKCSAGIITKDEIQRIIEPVSYDEYFYLLNDSLDKDDSSFFEALLWDLPNDLTFREEESILKIFIVDVRHREHESIATSFQVRFNNNIDNISTLLKSVDLIPQYLESYDFKYSYIRKIIYAIGAQPEPYNIEGLEKLSNETNDNVVRDLAVHQIEKRKELGRWEFRKNTES